MPITKNNKGIALVPTLSAVALVLVGSYFGYNYYSQVSSVSTKSNVEDLSSLNMANTEDVLQANIGNFNPGNQPFYWSYVDDRKPGIWNMNYYFTGRDVKSLEKAMDKIKETGFISFRDSKKPCYLGATRLGIWDTYPVEIKKLADDFYFMTVKNVKTYFKSQEDKICGVASTPVTFYYGLKSNEYVASPKNSFPVPASVYFSTTTKNTKSGLAAPAADANGLKIDVTGLKRIE